MERDAASIRSDGLVTAGDARLDAAADRDARLVDASGATSQPLFALGATTRGGLWEPTAVPDIRVQTCLN